MTAVHLIDIDPELGRYLPPPRRAAARRDLVARVRTLDRGPAEIDALAPAHAGVGFLVLEGLIERDVLVADTVSAELLGPGDLIRGGTGEDDERLLGVTVAWDVLAPTRVAVLDATFVRALALYPEVGAVVLDRLSERAHRLATAQAISQLNGVDRRLLALFWHLAERWGRMGTTGLVVPLDLPHRVLAQLVGARRPTVSTAMRRLAEGGELRRREDGAWVVQRQSAERWAPPEARAVSARRKRLLELADAEPEPVPVAPVVAAGVTEPPPLAGLGPALREARATADERVAVLREACADAVRLQRRTREMRERCRVARDGMHARRAARRLTVPAG